MATLLRCSRINRASMAGISVLRLRTLARSGAADRLGSAYLSEPQPVRRASWPFQKSQNSPTEEPIFCGKMQILPNEKPVTGKAPTSRFAEQKADQRSPQKHLRRSVKTGHRIMGMAFLSRSRPNISRQEQKICLN
jgi:hypothetical protein